MELHGYVNVSNFEQLQHWQQFICPLIIDELFFIHLDINHLGAGPLEKRRLRSSSFVPANQAEHHSRPIPIITEMPSRNHIQIIDSCCSKRKVSTRHSKPLQHQACISAGRHRVFIVIGLLSSLCLSELDRDFAKHRRRKIQKMKRSCVIFWVRTINQHVFLTSHPSTRSMQYIQCCSWSQYSYEQR